MDGVFVHDATALAAAIHPELFTWHRGAVVVLADGPARGHTIVDGGKNKEKRGAAGSAWWRTRRPAELPRVARPACRQEELGGRQRLAGPAGGARGGGGGQRGAGGLGASPPRRLTPACWPCGRGGTAGWSGGELEALARPALRVCCYLIGWETVAQSRRSLCSARGTASRAVQKKRQRAPQQA